MEHSVIVNVASPVALVAHSLAPVDSVSGVRPFVCSDLKCSCILVLIPGLQFSMVEAF